jgi:hypothetical protein
MPIFLARKSWVLLDFVTDVAQQSFVQLDEDSTIKAHGQWLFVVGDETQSCEELALFV